MKHIKVERNFLTPSEITQAVEYIRGQKAFMLIDLEATCTEDERFKATFQSEILEFGVCVLQGEEVHKHQIYVKPQLSAITEFCTKLTGIHNYTVKDAPYYEQACEQLAAIIASYGTDLQCWGSYGQYDINKIKNQSELFRCVNPVEGLKHMNIKTLAWSAANTKKAPGLGNALKQRGLDFEGFEHSGVDDAYNIARLVKYLLNSN